MLCRGLGFILLMGRAIAYFDPEEMVDFDDLCGSAVDTGLEVAWLESETGSSTRRHPLSMQC